MNHATERCLRLAEHLDKSQSWGLNYTTRLHYAQQVSALFPHIADLPDSQLRIILTNFHLDHRLVHALRDRHHPEHMESWNNWSRQAVRILATKLRHSSGVDLATMSMEDLAQEAMYDLWQALRNFRYESRFATWAFTIVSNCVSRAFRAAQTYKRRALVGAISLDPAPEQERPVPEVQGDCIESLTLGSTLAALSQQVLAQHPDVRLRMIFHLWTQEDQPLRVIGEQLNLSVPRVHALLNHAITLLRSAESIRDWAAQNE